VLDMDDRSLRDVQIGRGSTDGPARRTGFDITAASEVMAILSLSRDLADLRQRLARTVPARDLAGNPLTAEALGVAGAMAVLLRDAFAPNLFQTSEGTPVLVHTGPFGNIAPGCSSLVADRFALAHAEYVVTEAGFGSDLGAEKFVHLKAPLLGAMPDAAVLVVSVGCLREHGGGSSATPDPVAVRMGCANLQAHLGILALFEVPTVVAINRFPDDSDEELATVVAQSEAAGVDCVVHDAYVSGGSGCTELADAVVAAADRGSVGGGIVAPNAPVAEKVETIASSVYGAASVAWAPAAAAELAWLDDHGFGHLPVCVAKTHRSLSHDPHLLGAPSGFTVPVSELRLAAGAGYVTVLVGTIATMPGLPAVAHYRDLDLGPDGAVIGLS
ncbi:MAG TPA: formate--tetrahydrofolate ligase, partial [Acidimicrobiales bacterium]|nr:formate--tetrahydrofolate ligase [Acidimicrobiales bacterium]